MRILVVDTDPVVTRSIKRMLPNDEVTGETAAAAAIARIVNAESHGVPFSVVLCDINIDDARGIELLRTARDRRDPPLFVYLTTDAHTAEAAWLGDGVLIKPLQPGEVLNTVARLMLRRSRATTRRMRAVLPN